jgi:hypothetical protein
VVLGNFLKKVEEKVREIMRNILNKKVAKPKQNTYQTCEGALGSGDYMIRTQ